MNCLAAGIIQTRQREPVVLKLDRFPEWLNTDGADTLELWTWRGGVWETVPYQVDEVFEGELKPDHLLDPYDDDRHHCFELATPPPPGHNGPCERQYILRGSQPPAGTASPRDELVFLAGSTGGCDAPTASWPESTGLAEIRYRIMLSDTIHSESGCVYLFQRPDTNHPHSFDLVEYDTIGDGVPGGNEPGEPAECLPTGDACGALIGDPFNLDENPGDDLPSYRLDFYGNWSIDKWFIGPCAATPCPASEDLLDIYKWRLPLVTGGGPGAWATESEYSWDLYAEKGGCGAFVGYIDGPVRAIRVIEGAQSGMLTTRYEFAYPGEVLQRVYLRVHKVGTIYFFPDLLKDNVTSPTSSAKVYAPDAGGVFQDLDTAVDGNGPSCEKGAPPCHLLDPAKELAYQVSSDHGSFLLYYGKEKFVDGASIEAKYDDTTTSFWTGNQPPEWDDEEGEHAAARVIIGPLANTQNLEFCVSPESDSVTAIHETILVMLADDKSASSVGQGILSDRRGHALVTSVLEEALNGTNPPPPAIDCVPTLQTLFDNDGGPVENHIGSSASGCTPVISGWNLYQSVGAGLYRRLASLGLSATYVDNSLDLNEQRTYKASFVTDDGRESGMSAPLIVLHNDVVPPPVPADFDATAAPGAISASWEIPPALDLAGYKLLAGSQAGGPYDQVHPGILDPLLDSLTFSAMSQQTFYVVIRSVDYAGNESAFAPEVMVQVP